MKAKTPNQQAADFSLTSGRAISLFHPLTEKARAWLARHCAPSSDSNHQYLGESLVIEHRYVADIVAQAKLDGLTPLSR